MTARRGLALAVVVVATLVLVRAWTFKAAPPEPVRFEAAQIPAFSDGGTLTDAWADFDGDGDPDRFVGFNAGLSRLYRNDRIGGFTDVAAEVGLLVERPVRTSSWGDYDADGDPDLFLGYAGDGPVTALWRNDGGTFVDVTDSVGLSLATGATRQASWVDVDGDSDLDLFLALRNQPNRLWRNDGGVFTDVTEASGLGDPRRSVGAVWLDADRDGDLDVYVANMDGDANGMWVQTDGVFTDVASAWGLADGGRALGDEAQGTVRPCVVDFDTDGRLDLSTANYGTNGLFRNPPAGGAWKNVAVEAGLATEGHFDTCAWADFDHDAWWDLYVNGTVTGGVSYPDLLFRGEDGRFQDVTPPGLRVEADHGATWVDYDLDGDLDLALTGAQENGMHLLFQNLLRPEIARNSLAVRVVDERGAATRAGAEIRIYAWGGRRLLVSGIVDSGSGYDAQNDLPVHFGLLGSSPVDVEVSFSVAGERRTVRVRDVDPEAHRGKAVVISTGG